MNLGRELPLSLNIPVLETDRLILRAFQPHDFEPIVQFFADPISQFYGGPCDRDDAWRRLATYIGHWALRGFGPFALQAKHNDSFVGLCGPWYPEGWIEPEITWALMLGHHGQGYATEAARRALNFAYQELGWPTAVSVIAVDNPASARVAERLGATVESSITYRYGPAQLYRHAHP